ncbi:MAG: hypothetical protein EZS28_036512 [Streblomastix strix]|uniref:Uncharacterized protein n=1 Tax=Streblomastix strix TaxID=222440 RepID=A0A5J4UDJ8_9EUKA|nr:MAG: hypothetical protein EZS28_036512 [Streblomastix strix]
MHLSNSWNRRDQGLNVIDLHHFYKDYTPPDCLCPKRAEELDGIESRDCKCIPQNLRDECKTPQIVDCTKTPSDSSFPPVDGQIDCRKFPDDAACTEECKDSTEQTKEECACIVGDKR